MTVADWLGMILTVVATAALTVLGSYGVRYMVRGLAGAERASFGTFCFMLGAILVRHDPSSHSTEDVCRYAGGVIALVVIYRLWFGRKRLQED